MSTGKTTWLAVLFALHCVATAALNAAPRRDRRIKVEDAQVQKYKHLIEHIAEIADDEIAFCISGATPKMIAIFSPDKKGPVTVSRGAVFVPLGRHPASPELEVIIVSSLLLRRAQEPRWSAGVSCDSMPRWIVAAIVYRTWQKMAEAPPAAWYATSRQLALAEQAPDLRTLIENPISHELPLLYRLYADVCACTLRCVYNNRKTTLTNLLLPSNDTRFAAVAKELRLPEKKVQDWFEKEFAALALGNPVPTPLDHLKRALAQALESDVNDPNGKPLPIDTAMAKSKDLKLTADQRIQVRDRLLRLRIKTPPLLVPAIDQFIEAGALLAQGKDWRFQRKIRTARTAFDKAWQRANAIQAMLVGNERGIHSTAQRVDRMLKANPAKAVEKLEWEKRIEKYLDSYEKELSDAFIKGD